MAERKRTTKALAQRIDRGYFRRVFPIQRWRWLLTAATVAAGLLWIVLRSISHGEAVYSAGPLTPAHAMLGLNCPLCHVRTGGFTAAITDQTCSRCHDGALHRENQTFTPSCVDCHREHTSTRLTAVSDRQCVTCHGDLKVRTGEPTIAVSIHSFSGDHPEFAPQRRGMKDPGAIRFNHAVHLKRDLRGAMGNVTLVCSDCHRAGNSEGWPYGKTVTKAAASTNRKLMEPVNYYEHCSSCHPLTFDRRFSDPAPHGKPEIIDGFLTREFGAWLAAHPEELRGTSGPGIRIPGVFPPVASHKPAAWIAERVEEAEQLMRVKTCRECHEVAPASQGIPQIAQTNLTIRWFQHAEFDHSAHQMLVCDTCHRQARTSTKTSDVLLPGIAICRQCHVSEKSDAAASGCVECHVYHDPAQHKHVEGSFTSDQLAPH